jgi:hypothetical protein
MRDQDDQQRAELNKTSQKLVKLCVNVRSIAELANIDRETGKSSLKTLTGGRCVQNGPKGVHRRELSLREFLASKQITFLEHPPHSPDLPQ